MARFKNSFVFFLAAVLLLTACSPASPTAISSSPQPLNTQAVDQTYPPPPPTPTNPPGVVPFTIDKPVLEGTTVITGSGRPGVPVLLVDVTFMGDFLGTATVGEDGKYRMEVPVLEKDHRIGLTTGALEGTGWKAEDFQHPGYNGTEARSVPLVGFFFDTTWVRAK